MQILNDVEPSKSIIRGEVADFEIGGLLFGADNSSDCFST
jgi:hypothetical protein